MIFMWVLPEIHLPAIHYGCSHLHSYLLVHSKASRIFHMNVSYTVGPGCWRFNMMTWENVITSRSPTFYFSQIFQRKHRHLEEQVQFMNLAAKSHQDGIKWSIIKWDLWIVLDSKGDHRERCFHRSGIIRRSFLSWQRVLMLIQRMGNDQM